MTIPTTVSAGALPTVPSLPRHLLAAALTCVAFAYLTLSARKYRAGLVATSSRVVSQTEFDFPSVTVCSAVPLAPVESLFRAQDVFGSWVELVHHDFLVEHDGGVKR